MEPDKSFIRREKYTNPIGALFFKPEHIETIKDVCLFVLDTNVLMLPYSVGTKSLEVIGDVYSRLSATGQLFIPSQVIREFFDVRPQKISEIVEDLHRKMSQDYKAVGKYLLLENSPSYMAIKDKEQTLFSEIKNHRDAIKTLMDDISAWVWNDPVTALYQSIFENRILNDDFIKQDEIKKDLERRNTFNIPPGYKDKGKTENAAGDLLIWHEILNIGESSEKHLVFVSGDDKSDWWYNSGGRALYPRFELVEEYRMRSNGNSFHIISLSTLLSLFEPTSEAVTQIQLIEELDKELEEMLRFKNAMSKFLNSPLIKFLREVEFIDKNSVDQELYIAFTSSRTSTEFLAKINTSWKYLNAGNMDIAIKLFNSLKFDFEN